MTTLLYLNAPKPLRLVEALAEALPRLGDDAVGWVSSATSHQMIRLVDGEPHDITGRIDLTGVFSARLFTGRAELRWLHTGAGLGDTVLLTEEKASIGWQETSVTGEAIEGQYALWGRRFDSNVAQGWVRAIEGRIGWLDVPVTGWSPTTAPGQDWPTEYLALHYREYIAWDAHGNAQVIEERLLGIRPAAPFRSAR